MPDLRNTMPMMKATKAETQRLSEGQLYRVLTWFSPGFPIGAFSYSHGLETAAASGAVHDRETLQRWIAAILTHGAGRMDADTLRDAHRAAAVQNLEALTTGNRLKVRRLSKPAARPGPITFSTAGPRCSKKQAKGCVIPPLLAPLPRGPTFLSAAR